MLGASRRHGVGELGGRAAAARLQDAVARGVDELAGHGKPGPGLAVVLIGEDPASRVYVRSKTKQVEAVGMRALDHRLPATATEAEVLALVRRLNDDPNVNGILVQLPLPPHIRGDAVIDAVDPAKDVDGFHPVNAGLVAAGRIATAFVPCTPQGCLRLIKAERPVLAGLKAVVVGRSAIVGRPMAALLLSESCTVTQAHSRTRDLAHECRAADVLVVAAGRPEFVKGDWIKPGAVVVDVGINRLPKPDGTTRIVGDVDFDSARRVAGAITPVPGGVGPMTIACLLRNTLLAACRQHGLAVPPELEATP